MYVGGSVCRHNTGHCIDLNDIALWQFIMGAVLKNRE